MSLAVRQPNNLEELFKEVAVLKREEFLGPAFETWRIRVVQTMRSLFGEDSAEMKSFHEIRYSPLRFHRDLHADEDHQTYLAGMGRAGDFLKGLIRG